MIHYNTLAAIVGRNSLFWKPGCLVETNKIGGGKKEGALDEFLSIPFVKSIIRQNVAKKNSARMFRAATSGGVASMRATEREAFALSVSLFGLPKR